MEKQYDVIIVGTGMPKITPERQILANYYSDKLGDGFAFAYRFPGWQKVLQAVGRVIRTEEDTGFALLIDDRLDKPEYISLYFHSSRRGDKFDIQRLQSQHFCTATHFFHR